jgi:hypothetical protein
VGPSRIAPGADHPNQVTSSRTLLTTIAAAAAAS